MFRIPWGACLNSTFMKDSWPSIWHYKVLIVTKSPHRSPVGSRHGWLSMIRQRWGEESSLTPGYLLSMSIRTSSSRTCKYQWNNRQLTPLHHRKVHLITSTRMGALPKEEANTLHTIKGLVAAVADQRISTCGLSSRRSAWSLSMTHGLLSMSTRYLKSRVTS